MKNQNKTIGIIGARARDTIQDYYLVKNKFLEIYILGDTLVSGGCPTGGDSFAEMIAMEMAMEIIIHRPKWNKYGKRAGFIRNSLIAQDADVLIVCINSENSPGGTEHTIEQYLKLGKNQIYRV